MFHIWKARVASDAMQGTPGLMSAMERKLLIACGERSELELIEVQVEGRKRMSGTAFMNGHHLKDDEMLGVKVE
jgi:methionyl-tRNA formyltransferase